MAKSRGLGKGLDALFGDTEISYENSMPFVEPRGVEIQQTMVQGEPIEIDINLIDPNANQPRKNFDEDALRELADSISVHGIIQPIVLNKNGERFMIIAGERRWRASRLAGLDKVPAIIKNYDEKQIKEVSLVENLQREDLNPIEAGYAIKALMEEYDFTQDEVAKRIGKARPTIANTLRLLTLNDFIQELIKCGRLSAGHARCLVGMEDSELQQKLAKQACDNKMSVRELENSVRKLQNNADKPKKPVVQSVELVNLVENMQRVFATKVSAIGNDRKGRIYIDYYTTDDLDRILELMEFIQKNKVE